MTAEGRVAGATPAGSIRSESPTTGRRGTGSFHPVVATALVACVGYVVVAALAIGIGLLMTRELLHGFLGDWDASVTSWLVERRTSSRNDVSLVASHFSDTITVLAILVVVIGLLAWYRRWSLVGLLIVAMVVETATYLTATYFVERHRPRVPRLEELVVSDSYFSGHVAAATALYGCLVIVTFAVCRQRWVRVLVSVGAVFFPVAVALSRMYRGMHFASDVAGGVLVGLACIVVGLLAVTAGERAAKARRPQPLPEPASMPRVVADGV